MNKQKRALVCGAGGFIGGHLVRRLKSEGYFVRGVDIKDHEFFPVTADEFIRADLRNPVIFDEITRDMQFDELSSWRPTWAEPDMCFRANTTPRSCTTPAPSTSMRRKRPAKTR